MDDETLKMALGLRLQVCANALESVAVRMEGWAGNCRHGQADAEDADQIKVQLALIRAALDIARGSRTDVPPELRGSTVPDADWTTKILEAR